MRTRLQFVRWILGVALCGGVLLPCAAQKNHPAPPPSRQERPHFRQQQQPKQQNQPKGNPNRPPVYPGRPTGQPPSANRQNPGASANSAAGRNLTSRQQLGVGAPGPWIQKMREVAP